MSCMQSGWVEASGLAVKLGQYSSAAVATL